MKQEISIVVCAFDMQRELPRTMHSLALAASLLPVGTSCKVLIIDNGSTPAVDVALMQEIYKDTLVERVNNPSQSPIGPINDMVSQLRSGLIGLWIDGARMSSPGMLHLAADAYARDRSKVIGSLSFHLGPNVQMESVKSGYSQEVEDRLLETINWKEDGYSLFDVSVLAGSSRQGWFGCISESNAVFFDHPLWEEIGGFDDRFRSPGGGVANLEFWRRAVIASHSRPWIVLGEGTFHQVHGGAATNSDQVVRDRMFEEHRGIFGRPLQVEPYQAQYVGVLDARSWAVGEGTGNQTKSRPIRTEAT
jgi:hypothetical protein